MKNNGIEETEDEKICNEKSSKKNYDSFRKRVHSFRTFINYFYVEQNENPFHALIGPGPGHPKTFSLSHLWYVFIVCFIPVCSLLSTLGFIQPYLASDNTLCDWRKQPESCQSVIVVFITYRIGFSTTVFFLLTALILSKARESHPDGFSTLHTGFWIEKVIIVLLLSCVSFAFPPVTFDTVWIYIVLLGDTLFTCIMVFLLCDFIWYLHCKSLSFIDSRKWVYLNRKFSTSVEYTLAIVIKMGFLLGCIYTISNSIENQWLVVYITLMTIYLYGQLLHVILHQKDELLYTLYTTGFVYFLTWVTIVNHKLYNDNVHWQAIWSPTNIISLGLVYTITIYALIRQDKPYHFYYFYWMIDRGDTLELNQECLNSSKRKEKLPHKTYHNLNETLLDQSPEGMLGPTSREQQQQQQRQQYQQHFNYNNRCSATYSESFVHLFLALLSMKTTASVTNYNALVDGKYDYIATTKALPSIVALYISTIFVTILSTAYLYRAYMHENSDPFSVGLLLKSILQNLGRITSYILVGVPKCLQDSSLCRYVYSLFFIMVFTLACFIISSPFRKYFERLRLFCDHVTVFGACMSRDPAFVSLYRIFGTVGMFYWILSWLTVDIYPVVKFRNKIHKGCWFIKLLSLLVIFTCLANLPSTYSRYWLYFSLVSIFVFTLLQLLCLIDAVSLVSNLFISTGDTIPTKKIAVGSASLATLLYAISLIAYVCFYVFYAHNYRCAVTRLFVSINLVLCITASIISIHPIINNGGLLLSAVVTSFCMYNTWSALNYNPMEKCNPLAHTLLLVESRPSRDVVSVMDLFVMFIAFVYFNIRIKEISRRAFDASLLSTLYSLVTKNKVNSIDPQPTNISPHLLENSKPTDISKPLLESLPQDVEDENIQVEKWLAQCNYTTPEVNTSSQQYTVQQNPTKHDTTQNSPNVVTPGDTVNKWHYPSSNTNEADPESGLLQLQETKANTKINDTADKFTQDSPSKDSSNHFPKGNTNRNTISNYSYSCLHFVCYMACSYSFLMLAHWLEPVPGSGFKISLHWTIMTVKLVSSTFSVLIYIWFMMVPIIDNKTNK